MMKKLFFISVVFLSLGCEQHNQKTKVNLNSVEARKNALEKAPSFENYIAYGLVLAEAKRGPEALKAYQKAAQINPQAPVAWNNICFELISQGNPVQAVQNCEKALSIEPKFQLAKNNLVLAKQKIEALKAEAEKKKTKLKSDPRRAAQEVIDTGMAFYSISEYEKAIEVWDLISPKDEKFAVAQNNIASSNILLGRLWKAERALNKALYLDKQNTLFQNNKKWLEEEKKKLQK